MKRRLIITVLIICLIFAAFSCSKTPQNVDEQNNSQQNQQGSALVVRLPATLQNSIYNCTDFFTATVLASEVLPKETPIDHRNILDFDAVLYTVEVKNAIRDFSVTENTKINVIRFIREVDEQPKSYDPLDIPGDYYHPFEIGNTYLICGKVQVLDNKPFILDDFNFSAQVKDDGTLVPMSLKSSEFFKDIKTYDELLQNDDVKEILKENIIDLPNHLYPLLKTKPNLDYWNSSEHISDPRPRDRFAVVISEKEEARKLIKEAMPIDVKKTIDVKNASYEKLVEKYENYRKLSLPQ